jgi:Skp family chaperone for outer membrane proteins
VTKPPFPLKALEQHIGVLGKTRSGKSTALRGITEGLLERKEPVCIVDPKGDWWGLKISKDGKGSGFPIVVFGGKHADVPIDEHSGATVAELFATGNRSCLIDLGGWMPGARTRFWVAFASTLFRLNQGQRWLVVDEIHNFAPKGKVLDPGQGQSLHWTNRLASEGLGLGIAMLFASQRPQKVHNDTLTQAETLIAMRVMHPADQGAITDWVKTCGDPKIGKQVLDSLAQLERGEGWVWSPEIGFGPERVKFPMFKTYDSFRPQTAADAKNLKGWAEVDLEDVKAKLAAVVAEAAANDPKALRAEIARLKAELAKAGKGAITQEDLQRTVTQARQALASGIHTRARRILTHSSNLLASLEKLDLETDALLQEMDSIAEHADLIDVVRESKPVLPSNKSQVAKKADLPVSTTAPRRAAGAGDAALTKAERALLAVLAQRHPKTTTRIQISILSGYSKKSSSFANALGALRSKGYVDGTGDANRATDAGLAAAGDYDPLPTTGPALLEHWLGKLTKAEAALLRALATAYPDGLSREELGLQADYSITSSSFSNALGSLRSLELVMRGEPIVASEEFFQ